LILVEQYQYVFVQETDLDEIFLAMDAADAILGGC
jgi:hypothetical protein